MPHFEVDVPIHHIAHPELQGVHVFTGVAESSREALQLAHQVYDHAVHAHQSGSEIPDRRPDGWAARGLRPGWQLDWASAKVGRWDDPHRWTRGHCPFGR